MDERAQCCSLNHADSIQSSTIIISHAPNGKKKPKQPHGVKIRYQVGIFAREGHDPDNDPWTPPRGPPELTLDIENGPDAATPEPLSETERSLAWFA